MKKGFTLAEMMVVLLVAGVIAALTIPVLLRNVGNTDRVLFKSAYRLVETAVSDLASDISLYPSGTFDNTFCNNFGNKINTIGTFTCVTTGNNIFNGMYNYKTSNGMGWNGFSNIFGPATDPQNTWVDINGQYKGTNKLGSDIFMIQLYKSGKVGVIGTAETDYLVN